MWRAEGGLEYTYSVVETFSKCFMNARPAGVTGQSAARRVCNVH
jgi:hypothetical protein